MRTIDLTFIKDYWMAFIANIAIFVANNYDKIFFCLYVWTSITFVICDIRPWVQDFMPAYFGLVDIVSEIVDAYYSI